MSHLYLTPRQHHAAKLMLSGRMPYTSPFDFEAWDEFKALVISAPVDEDPTSDVERTIGEVHAVPAVPPTPDWYCPTCHAVGNSQSFRHNVGCSYGTV